MQKLQFAPKITTNDHFVRHYTKLGELLPPREEKLVNYIYDTFSLSIENNFYDSKEHKYYVVASQETLAKKLWCSTRTVGRMVKELRKKGYFYTKQPKDKALQFFSNNFFIEKSEKDKLSSTRKTQSLSNHIHSQPNLDKHIDTNDTSRAKKANKLNIDDKIKNKVLDLFSGLIPSKEENKYVNDNKDSEHLNYSIEGTNAIPKGARVQINKLASMLKGNNEKAKYRFIYNINGIIFNTKHNVSESYNLQDYFRWENNNDLVSMFNSKIYNMVYATYVTKNPDSTDKYLYGTLYNFFEKIAKRKLGITTKHKQYNIPKKQKDSNKSKINEQVPEFIEHPEKHTGNKLDPKKKAEIQARLKRLNAKLD